MKEATVAAEYLIVGFLCFINILFLGFILLGLQTLKVPQGVVLDKEIIIFILLAIFYILGALTHKLSIIQNSNLLPRLKKIIPHFNYLKPLSDEEEYKRQIVFKNASTYQIHVIDNEYKFNILFRCVSILLFPLSFTFSLWLYMSGENIKTSLFTWSVIIIISILSFKSHKTQYLKYWKLIFICYDSLNTK